MQAGVGKRSTHVILYFIDFLLGIGHFKEADRLLDQIGRRHGLPYITLHLTLAVTRR